MVLARGGSHRTTTDVELIRWGADVARIEGSVDGDEDSRSPSSGRAPPRPPAARGSGSGSTASPGAQRRSRERLRVVLFAPEDMLLVAGSPSLRRAALDRSRRPLFPAYGARPRDLYAARSSSATACSARSATRPPTRDELRYWDRPFLDAGGAVVAARLRLLDELAGPLAAAHAEIAPGGGAPPVRSARIPHERAARPGEAPRDALERRLAETAEKEVWNGTTLVGPHRDDLAFVLDGPRPRRRSRRAASSAPRSSP